MGFQVTTLRQCNLHCSDMTQIRLSKPECRVTEAVAPLQRACTLQCCGKTGCTAVTTHRDANLVTRTAALSRRFRIPNALMGIMPWLASASQWQHPQSLALSRSLQIMGLAL